MSEKHKRHGQLHLLELHDSITIVHPSQELLLGPAERRAAIPGVSSTQREGAGVGHHLHVRLPAWNRAVCGAVGYASSGLEAGRRRFSWAGADLVAPS